MLHKVHSILSTFAVLALITGLPFGADAYDDVKRVKVKDHKVKVKMFNGKAKIKQKGYGKEKIKVKGPNGQIAASIASEAMGQSHAPHGKSASGYYK